MRNPEQEIDISIYEELKDAQAYEYLKGKYSEELAKEVRKLFEKSIENKKSFK